MNDPFAWDTDADRPLLTWALMADLLDQVREETWAEAEWTFSQRYGEIVSDYEWAIREKLKQFEAARLDPEPPVATLPDMRPRWRRRVA